MHTRQCFYITPEVEKRERERLDNALASADVNRLAESLAHLGFTSLFMLTPSHESTWAGLSLRLAVPGTAIMPVSHDNAYS